MAKRPHIFRGALRIEGLALGALMLGSTAWAQADAGGHVDQGAFPPGFDCGKLESPRTRLECQTFQAHRMPKNNAVPPGTPAIPMPGESNSTSGPYIGTNQNIAPNQDLQNVLHGRRTSH